MKRHCIATFSFSFWLHFKCNYRIVVFLQTTVLQRIKTPTFTLETLLKTYLTEHSHVILWKRVPNNKNLRSRMAQALVDDKRFVGDTWYRHVKCFNPKNVFVAEQSLHVWIRTRHKTCNVQSIKIEVIQQIFQQSHELHGLAFHAVSKIAAVTIFFTRSHHLLYNLLLLQLYACCMKIFYTIVFLYCLTWYFCYNTYRTAYTLCTGYCAILRYWYGFGFVVHLMSFSMCQNFFICYQSISM